MLMIKKERINSRIGQMWTRQLTHTEPFDWLTEHQKPLRGRAYVVLKLRATSLPVGFHKTASQKQLRTAVLSVFLHDFNFKSHNFT